MADLVDQKSAMPTRKVLAGAVAGIITAALMKWAGLAAAMSPWTAWLGDDLVKAAVPVLAATAAAYIVRERVT